MDTHRNVPRHVVLACEGGGVYALRCVNDAYERPNGGEECGWEDVVSEGAREPPEVGRRVFRDGRGVDQEEEERAGGPDLERQFEVRDLRGFDLYARHNMSGWRRGHGTAGGKENASTRGRDTDVTYGSESFVGVCFHAEETRLYFLVAGQWWVERDAHDLRLGSRILDLELQVHPLYKCPSIYRKRDGPSLVHPPHLPCALQRRTDERAGWGGGEGGHAHLGVD